MHRFTTLAKKHEGTTTRESRDARNTNAGYPRGYHNKSSLFGFLLSLPERVQRAVTARIRTAQGLRLKKAEIKNMIRATYLTKLANIPKLIDGGHRGEGMFIDGCDK